MPRPSSYAVFCLKKKKQDFAYIYNCKFKINLQILTNTVPTVMKRLPTFSLFPYTTLFRSAERMPHDLSHLGFLAGQIGRLITISTTPVIAGDSFEMDAVGALRLSPLRRGLAIDSTVDIFTFYVPHRHVYGEQWIKFM